jgi:methylthioxylose transferase
MTSAPTTRSNRPMVVAFGAASAIVAVSVGWGWRVQRDERVKLGAAPLVGEWSKRFGWSLVLAVALATAVVVWGSAIGQRLRFRTVLLASGVVSAAFTLLLAASDGLGHVLDPVVHPTEYWANLATLPPAHAMLQRYGSTDFLLDYSVHAKGHPPGFLLLLKALAAIGLGRPWVAGALSYIGAAVVVVAVLATVRRVASEDVARKAAPFFVVAPYAVWMGTSADAFYTAFAAVGVWVLVVALQHDGRRAVPIAIAAGAVLSTGLFLTYGMAMFLLLPGVLTVGLLRRERRSARATALLIGSVVIGALAVALAFRLAGFWWFDGAGATRKLYWWGTAQFRPWKYFLVANLGAACIAVGPSTVVGLSGRRERGLGLIVGGALLCVFVSDASQYSKAEVERIWLLFYPWLVPAAAVLSRKRLWLAAQAVLAVGLQLALVSKW